MTPLWRRGGQLSRSQGDLLSVRVSRKGTWVDHQDLKKY